MPLKTTKEPLERTSVQLPRRTIELLDSWSTLNRSEALRLTVERYHYFEAIAAPHATTVIEKYRPVFQRALADLSYGDFKVVARSLPAIVMGAMAEPDLREEVEWERRQSDEPPINWQELQREVSTLDPLARVRVLDHVVGERHSEESKQGEAMGNMTIEIRNLEKRIQRQPEWKQQIIRATLAAIPHVENEHDRDVLLPLKIKSLLGPETTMNGSTVHVAVEKIKMILDGEASPEAVEACRLAGLALRRK